MAAGAECKIDAGSDLVIWTKHFTTFVTYTQTAIPAAPVTAPEGNIGGGNGPIFVATSRQVGDINKDGEVNKYDFALLMADWGKTGMNASDLNHDGKVDAFDFALFMLAKWNE